MSAPEHAIPLQDENADWAKGETKRTRVICMSCDWKGYMYELLCVDEETTMWCPICRSAGWTFV
jgi:hypothetical protein